jgi:hypothetical protein
LVLTDLAVSADSVEGDLERHGKELEVVAIMTFSTLKRMRIFLK